MTLRRLWNDNSFDYTSLLLHLIYFRCRQSSLSIPCLSYQQGRYGSHCLYLDHVGQSWRWTDIREFVAQ
ncbi:hypothetical protein BDV95DRAFT_572920 [Massariosphaeria phaeospora]|uniref:Uncharacterized protein n=1 Tax=Massariosphaeria phaeospora TaxID=100035 RepID=A0A7C8I4Y3_9PLEO|nr:hypothetical protein BDV95DRAFT_572920 [Massariosphaeria phaeospora]